MRQILLALTVLWPLLVQAQSTPLPSLDGPVMDMTDTLSPTSRADITRLLLQYEQDTGHQLAVFIINSTGEEAIEPFATRVFERWKLGDKIRDDGLLLVVAKADRTLRIEVGYGLEGVVTDVQASQIINRNIVLFLSAGNMSVGSSQVSKH